MRHASTIDRNLSNVNSTRRGLVFSTWPGTRSGRSGPTTSTSSAGSSPCDGPPRAARARPSARRAGSSHPAGSAAATGGASRSSRTAPTRWVCSPSATATRRLVRDRAPCPLPADGRGRLLRSRAPDEDPTVWLVACVVVRPDQPGARLVPALVRGGGPGPGAGCPGGGGVAAGRRGPASRRPARRARGRRHPRGLPPGRRTGGRSRRPPPGPHRPGVITTGQLLPPPTGGRRGPGLISQTGSDQAEPAHRSGPSRGAECPDPLPDATAGWVGPVGIEPTTRGLKVRCSAS